MIRNVHKALENTGFLLDLMFLFTFNIIPQKGQKYDIDLSLHLDYSKKTLSF